MYSKQSTANPLGKRPWNFALSNNGLNFYQAAQFPVPFVSPPPRAGLGDASNFFVADPSTLPPAPSGYQYTQSTGQGGVPQWTLAKIPPPPGPSPLEMLLIGGAGAFAIYYFSKKKAPKILPMVKMPAL